MCVLCGRSEESLVHLFLDCHFIENVWVSVMRWLDFSLITPVNFFVHRASWRMLKEIRRFGRGWGLSGMQLFRQFGKREIILYSRIR